jgi:glycosyltransferase involved in cell wall biosynthesis
LNSPLLSVVLPVYNAECWIASALSSTVHAAKQLDAEIIVVDDGSTDASVRLIDAQAAKSRDVRIRLVRQPANQGIVQALNRGLDTASGRFIARMDADDICMPERFQGQLAFLERTGVDICGSWFVEFGQGLPRISRWPHGEAAVKTSLLFQNTICHPTVVARREVFEKYRYRNEYRLAEDYDLFARASAEFRLANVPQALLRYRRHPQQATQAQRESMERVTRRIRLEALRAQGIAASDFELEMHHAIRAPKSIRRMQELEGVEAWLLKLIDLHENPESRRTIALQWLRACIRAAPLGMRMLRAYRASPLRKLAETSAGTTFDVAVLAATRLDYASPAFAALRRFGISA